MKAPQTWKLAPLPKGLLLFTLVAAFGSNQASAQIFTNLYDFTALNSRTNYDGARPHASLILSGNCLYGTTGFGGIFSNGTVFAINTDGTGFTNLHSFTGNDGAEPAGALICSGNILYGTAAGGGLYGNGTVFAINTDGTDFTNLYNFSAVSKNSSGTYTNGDGAGPYAGLVLCSNMLYGTTSAGGNAGAGTVFAVNTDGTGFTNLYNFTNNSGEFFSNPGLILSGNTLYGTTYYGGSFNNGVVFAINTDGTGFTNLYDFSPFSFGSNTNSDGANPSAGLILSVNTLYGTASEGGSYGFGTVFAISTNGMGFTNLYNFTGGSDNIPYTSTGANPGPLILYGGALYGTAVNGGSSNDGTIFTVNTNGQDFTNLYNFTALSLNTTGIYTNSDGAQPYVGLILSGNTLYGTAIYGGSGGSGTVFALSLGSIPVNIQTSGQTQTITWGNPAFSLQTAPAPTGPWITLSNTSPYTITATNTQQFFQLVYTNSP